MQLKRRNRQGGGATVLFKKCSHLYFNPSKKDKKENRQNSFSQFIYNRKPFDSVYFFFINI